MPQFEIAATSLLQLLGLLNDKGSIEWTWLGDPSHNMLKAIPGGRQHFGRLIRALEGTAAETEAAEPPFEQLDAAAQLVWAPLAVGPVQVGFAWTTDPAGGMRVAIAARGNPISADPGGGAPLTLAVIARLVDFSTTDISAEFGDLLFSGSFPVPDFLAAASMRGAISRAQVPPDLELTVQDKSSGPNDTRVFSLASKALGWDVARLSTFLLQAFATQHVSGPDFLPRVAKHLPPMLGSDGGAIGPFPVYQPMGTTPTDFEPWRSSVLGGDPNKPEGALAFLWHLRALLTGNESADFLTGSYHFPLVGPGTATLDPKPPTKSSDGTPGAQPLGNDTGAWMGITDAGQIVLELRCESGKPLTVVPLAEVNGSQLVRPLITPATMAGLDTLPDTFSFALTGGDATIDGTKGVSGWRISLFHHTLTSYGPGLDGMYGVDVVLDAGTAPHFIIATPVSGPVDPAGPVDTHAIVAGLLKALVGSLPSDAHALAPLVQTLVAYVAGALDPQQPQPSIDTILTAAAAAFGPGGIRIGDSVTVGVAPGGELAVAGDIGPLDLGTQSNIPIRIGKLHAGATFSLQNGEPLRAFSVGLVDFRVALQGGAASGLLASIIPDLTQVPGFSLGVTWSADAPSNVAIKGGGRIPVQRTLGPLAVNTLAVDIDRQRVRVGIDLSLQLSVITVAAHELGVEFRFDNGTTTPFLHGLALSCNTGGIVLAGMFGAVEDQGHTDYVGGAVVSVMNLFQLSAIGGYTQIGTKASLFIFASLTAPIGGPPFMFITGIAGGFGYNRTLPPAGPIADHPFLRVMRGDIPLGASPSDALTAVGALFAPMDRQQWIAAGIQFTSFGFINGKIVVAIGFGHELSLTVLGLAAFGIKPLAYFEIEIAATANETEFVLVAGVSANSYLLHPDIFSLRGQFALMTRHADPGAGDFVFSIGGYHPAYRPPTYYPTVDRVGVKATLYGFVRLSIDCFFACTPQAIMAGAQLSLAAEFAGIGVGLDVYVDVFIQWDPFFLQAELGVALWFEFFGRHEISATLQIHTPPLGGTAHVDLAIVSFDVDFGTPLAKPLGPTLGKLLSGQLGVNATEQSLNTARYQRFNDETGAGLFRIDVAWGRPSDVQAWTAKTQEGLVDRIRVNAEFGFTVRTHLPIAESKADLDTKDPGTAITGHVHLPLCRLDVMQSTLDVTGFGVAAATRGRMPEFFPASLFGDDPLPDPQDHGESAQSAIGKLKADGAVISLTEGISFDYVAALSPATSEPLVAAAVEYSEQAERFPLPLDLNEGEPPSFDVLLSSTVFSFDYSKLKVSLAPSAPRAPRATLALAAARARVNRPLHVTTAIADVQRFPSAVRTRGFTVTVLPTGTVVMAPPPSPGRRAELFGVHLRMVAPYAPVSLRRQRLDGVRQARNVTRARLTPPDGLSAAHRSSHRIETFRAEQLVVEGGRTLGGRLHVEGTQWLRMISQSTSGAFLSDVHVAPGTTDLALPANARRVTWIGAGAEQLVSPATRASAPSVTDTIGIERDSVLMALGKQAFVGHGCVLESHGSLGIRARALDHAPGFVVLGATRRARVHFPAVAAGSTLVLTVAPAITDAGSALDEVRWLGQRATLSGLMTVVAPDRTALMMTVATSTPWTLELDIGSRWSLVGVVVSAQRTRALYEAYRASSDWALIDDRLQTAARTATTVSVEIDYE